MMTDRTGQPVYWITLVYRSVMDSICALLRLVLMVGFGWTSRSGPDGRVLLLVHHGGDLVYMRGLLGDWMEQNGIPHVDIWCEQRFKDLMDLWSASEVTVHVMPGWLARVISRVWRNHLGYRREKVMCYGWIGELKISGCSALAGMELFFNRYSSQPGALRYQGPDLIAHRSAVQRNRPEQPVVLLAPYAQSLALPVAVSFWEQIAERFSREGFCVLTNTGAGESAVAGTEPFGPGYRETLLNVAAMDLVVGVRSGLMDLLAFSETPLMVLYPDEWSREVFCLDVLGPRGPVSQWVWPAEGLDPEQVYNMARRMIE